MNGNIKLGKLLCDTDIITKRQLNKALQLHQKGQVNEAISTYLKVLTEQEKNSQLLFLLGTAYIQISNFDLAVK